MSKILHPRWQRTVSAASGVALCAAGILVGRALASGIPVTGALTYSGVVEDASGNAVSGNHNIQVNFWNSQTGGTTPLCLTASVPVTLTAGRFSVPLPDSCTAAVQANKDVWAEVLFDGTAMGRSKLGAVPYAVEAAHATAADSAPAGSSLDARINAVVPAKTIVSAYVTAAELAANFDATGLGRAGTSYTGWALCNGGNGTPNLAGRFVRVNLTGAGATGGNDVMAHTHAIDHAHPEVTTTPESGHTHATPDHQHQTAIGFDGLDTFWIANAAGLPLFGSVVVPQSHFVGARAATVGGNVRIAFTDMSGGGTTGAGSPHSHTVDVPPFSGASGPASFTDNRPAYFELVALMKL
jgi:hypothetical protein